MKKIGRIILALLLSGILTILIQGIFCGIQHIEQSPSPKISLWQMTSSFKRNKEKFETVRDYIQTQDNGLYLTAQNYSEIVQDENVKSALEVVFDQLHCDDINGCTFEYFGNYRNDIILYTEDIKDSPDNQLGHSIRFTDLGDNWYIISRRFDALYIIEPIPPVFLCVIFTVLSVGLYLLLDKMPLFKKSKKQKEPQVTPNE